MNEIISRVTIIAVGVSNYEDANLKNLRGAENDVALLKMLLVESKQTAIYDSSQFIEISNPKINELRDIVTEYALDRFVRGDILLFYFSGHGVPIGRDEFGFCARDTKIHPNSGKPLPLTVLKFRDLVRTFHIANVTPVIIIDACYSGAAIRALPPVDVVTSMRHQIYSLVASKFALLFSCADDKEVEDTSYSGVFCHYLFNVANDGILGTKLKPSRPSLGLRDIYPNLDARISSYSGSFSPRIYLGPTLPDFPFVKNTKYRPNAFSFSKQSGCIVLALWDNGNCQELTIGEIGEICGPGAYGNHRKLSLGPWQLLEDVPNTNPQQRRLTEAGKKFASGALRIPKKIIKDPDTEIFNPVAKTAYVKVTDFQ